MARRYSQAVIALAALASTYGIRVSPREIERWRQAGLIPQPDRIYPGRGSRAIYSDKAAAQAAEVAKYLRNGWRLEEIAVPLFLHGFRVGEETVKRAFKAHADHVRYLISRRSPDGDTLTVAEAAGRTLLRALRGDPRLVQWRERVGGMGAPRGAILESAVTNFMHVLLTGEPASEEGMYEFFVASGIKGLLSSMSEILGEELSLTELNELITKLDLSEYVRLVDEFSLDDLLDARVAMSEMVDAAVPLITVLAASLGFPLPDDLATHVSDIAEPALLFGLPLIAWMMNQHPAGVAQIRAALHENANNIKASLVLLDHLPEPYWRFLGPNGAAELEAAPEKERSDALRIVRQALATDVRLRGFRTDTVE
jgi:DNA-binding transcriptional MerR regulator